MHDAARMRAMMRWSIGLLLVLAVGACGSTAKPGPDGGGGSNAGGAGGTTGGGGRGGGGGAAGSAGGQSGGGGTGGCAPNQVWCPGCEPGTGACSCRRLSWRRLSAAGRRSRRVWIGRRVRQRRHRRSWRYDRLGRPRWRRRRLGRTRRIRRRHGRHGWSGGVRDTRLHRQRDLRATELRRHGPALSSCSRRRSVSERIHVPFFLRQHRNAAGSGSRLRAATVHSTCSLLLHRPRVVRQRRDLLVPTGKRLSGWRIMRPHQRRPGLVSLGLIRGGDHHASSRHSSSVRPLHARGPSGSVGDARDHDDAAAAVA